MIKRTPHSWAYRHRVSLGITIFTSIACTTFLSLVIFTTNHKMQAIKRESAVMTAHYDKLIPELKARREAQEAASAQVAEEAKTATPATPSNTTVSCTNLPTGHGDPSRIDVLVNKAHCLSPLDFAPSDLVSVDGYLVSAKAAPHLREMLAVAAIKGLTITPTSSYRSYEGQIATYSERIATKGSTDAADTVSARPGYSEHQTGLAVDLKTDGCALECFAGTPHYTWLQLNAAKYGFIQRYHEGHEHITGYNPEAWHYRYVGPQVALDMQKRSIKTLEQYWGISGGDYPR